MQASRQERGYTPRPKVGYEHQKSLDSDDEAFVLTYLAPALNCYPHNELSEPSCLRVKDATDEVESRKAVGEPEVQSSSLSSPQLDIDICNTDTVSNCQD